MKNLKVYLLSLIVIVGFFACSDDDSVGQLGYEGAESVTLEVHRDTANSYRISLPITSESGLAKVSLIDNSNSKTLDEKTSFTDPKSYTYTYDFDLTDYTVNSAIMLTLKIEDVDGQVVKQNITINVKKFSELDIRFGFEGTLASFFEDCNLKFTVVRGMIPLKEVQVFVGNQLSSTYDLSLDATQSKYELNLLIDGLAMGNNEVKVVVVDNKDQEFEKVATVRRESAKTWAEVNRIVCSLVAGGNRMMINDAYYDGSGDLDEYDRFYRIELGNEYPLFYYLDFNYEGDKVVDMIYSTYDDDPETFVGSTTYHYVYNSDGQLTKVTKKVDSGIAADYITDVVYELGIIKSYKVDGKDVTATYLEKDGEMIRVDYLDADMSGYTYGLKNRTSSNPLYLSGLPAVVPGSFNGFELNMLYNRYIFDTLEDNGSAKITYTVGGIEDADWAWTQSITWQQNGKDQTLTYTYYKE